MPCENCKVPRIMGDHAHHYDNSTGGITTTWWIDGRAFLTPRSVERYMKETYNLVPVEVLHFLRTIPAKYN